jgi:F-type H+-transporting ATPase subunit delta
MESIHKSYAIALFDLANEAKQLEKYQEETKAISNILKDNKEFLNLLTNQFINKDDKKQLLDNVFKGKVEGMILNFLKLLVDKQRFNLSVEIFKEFNSLANDYRGIKEGILYTASSLEEAKIKAIEAKVAQKLGKKVELTMVKDETLIGGFKVVISDLVIDNSIKNKLESLKNDLVEEKVGG